MVPDVATVELCGALKVGSARERRGVGLGVEEDGCMWSPEGTVTRRCT